MLRFVVALEAEARPLIERYGLARDSHRGFKVFRRDEVALVVSGVGKTASAAATSYLHLAAGGGCQAAWLNVDIAGQRGRPVGEAVVAHKIRDFASERCWYPPQVLTLPCVSDEVLTVDRPENDFEEPAVYDKEASGFYDAACRFATAELVQCLKVISDGPGSDLTRLTARRIGDLVAGRLAVVEELAEGCLGLHRHRAAPAAPPPAAAAGACPWRHAARRRSRPPRPGRRGRPSPGSLARLPAGRSESAPESRNRLIQSGR